MLTEGYRDTSDPRKIIISGAFDSNQQYPRSKSCMKHTFCSEAGKLIENAFTEETQPQPLLPFNNGEEQQKFQENLKALGHNQQVPNQFHVQFKQREEYLNSNFEIRNFASKARVMIDIDQAKPINKRDPIIVQNPTSEGLEEWKVASEKLGHAIKQQKEMIRSGAYTDMDPRAGASGHHHHYHNMGANHLSHSHQFDHSFGAHPDRALGASFTSAGSANQHGRKMFDNERYHVTAQLIERMDPLNQFLRPSQKCLPEIAMNPLFQDDNCYKEPCRQHIPRLKEEGKENAKDRKLLMQQKTKKMSDSMLQKSGKNQFDKSLSNTNAGTRATTPYEHQQQASNRPQDEYGQKQEQPKTGGRTAEDRVRQSQKQPWNTKQQDPIKYLKSNHGHRFSRRVVSNSQSVLEKEKPWYQADLEKFKFKEQPHNIGENLYRKVLQQKQKLIQEIKDQESAPTQQNEPTESQDFERGDESDENLKILNEKQISKIQERQQLLVKTANARRREQAKQRQADMVQERWDLNYSEQPKYDKDMRYFMKPHPDKFRHIKGIVSHQDIVTYDSMVENQDKWQRFSQFWQQELQEQQTSLGAEFDLAKEPITRVAVGANKDFLPNRAKSEMRVTRIQRVSKQIRHELRKEDLGILAYMRRQGMEKPENYKDCDKTIDEFRQLTSFHPQLIQDKPVPKPKVEVQEDQEDKQEKAPAPPVKNNKNSDDESCSDSGSERPTSALASQPAETANLKSEVISEKSAPSKRPTRVELTQPSRDVPQTPLIGDETPAPMTSQTSLNGKPKLTDEHVIAQVNHITSLSAPKVLNNNVYMDADFWYHKGVVLNGDKTQKQAPVQCYLQALKINSNHLPSIFNLACKYQELKDFEEARRRFAHAIEVNPAWPDALYGLCLVNIELKEPAEAVKYIQKAIQVQGDAAAPHIKYALALAHRTNYDWDNALKAYSAIMKTSEGVDDYRKKIDQENQKIAEDNAVDNEQSLDFKVDLFSHFKQLGIQSCRYNHFVDLWPYYDPAQGWDLDKQEQVISLLLKVRFFNRFDRDTLKMMLQKVTLRRIKKGEVLFFKGEEAAILVTGRLNLLSHEQCIDTPYVAVTYNPGDIIGLSIDNGWSDAQHSWVCAWEECDVLLISDDYLEYLWDKQKRFSSNIVADLIDQAPLLSEMSEQTLFTIAHDIAVFKEYRNGETIINQDNNSEYNMIFQQMQHMSIKNLKGKDDLQYKDLLHHLKQGRKPQTKEVWQQKELENTYSTLRRHIQREKNKLEAARMRDMGIVGGNASLASKLSESAIKDDQDSQEGSEVGEKRSARNEDEGFFKAMGNRALAEQKAKSFIANLTTSAGGSLQPEEHDLKYLQKVQKDNKQKIIELGHQSIATGQRYFDLYEVIQEKLNKYKEDKDVLPKDSDGIYIMAEGEAKIVNKYHPDQKLRTLTTSEYFGESKFIQQIGYSYFGDIIACQSAKKVDKNQSNTRSRRGTKARDLNTTGGSIAQEKEMGTTKDANELTFAAAGSNSQTQSKQVDNLNVVNHPLVGSKKDETSIKDNSQIVTTCMFLPQQKLYLIPFYDLALLREKQKEKFKKSKLRVDVKNKYADTIRKLNEFLNAD